MKVFVYQTSSKGRCGCRNFSNWCAMEAASKAEIIRKKKMREQQIEVLTAEQFFKRFGVDYGVRVYDAFLLDEYKERNETK